MTIPIQPIYLFADSQLLFWQEDGRPFLQTLRDQIDKASPKAAYIGASNGNQPEYYSIFEGAMDLIGIKDCRMLSLSYNAEDREFLMAADIILLAGGEVDQGWQTIDKTGLGQDIIQRYYDQSILIGISAGAVQLGLKGWHQEEPETEDDLFDTFKLIPFVVDAHDEANQWRRLKTTIKLMDSSYTKGLGLPSGGGLIYHPDHTIEPVRQSLTEFSLSENEVTQTLLFPPEEGMDTEQPEAEPGPELVDAELLPPENDLS